MLRTETHTYVHRRSEDDELYDRMADPEEITNLLAQDGASPTVAERASELRELMFGWLADTSDVIPWHADPRFPDIQHGWR